MRLTSDVALLDEKYAAIVKKFAEDQKALDDAFAGAWFKLVTSGGVWSRVNYCLQGPPIATMLNDDVITV